MPTTIRLDPHLLAQAKKTAIDSGRTLTTVIEDALRAALGARRTPGRRERTVTLTIVDGHGVQPGVDLDDSAALLDVLDDDRGTP